MKKYLGRVTPRGRDWTARVDDGSGPVPLDPRLDLRGHSPDGFAWGYAGSGPAQLALAMLADCLGEEAALAFYQDFKEQYVAKMDINGSWDMDETAVRRAVERIRRERRRASAEHEVSPEPYEPNPYDGTYSED